MTLSEVAAELRDFKNRVESFFTGAEAKEGLSKATAQIAAFEQKLSAAQAQTANITTLETNHAQAIAAKDKEIADLKAKHVSDLAAKDAEVNLKAGTKAVEMVAKTGAQPVKEELQAGNPGESADDVFAQYNAIKDPKARGEFFNKNRAELLGK